MGFKEARMKSGLTVLQAADKLGVSDATIYMWENGEMTPRTARLIDIARLYGVTVDELLRGKEEAQ